MKNTTLIVKSVFCSILLILFILFTTGCNPSQSVTTSQLKQEFANPPDNARPGVYWYFMDGNYSREEMTADLESMKAAGIGNVVFLEVNVGVPRGPVDMLSEEWQDLFVHLVREAERLGIEITLGVGPGWSGSGGPWVKPEQSMRHLVASVTELDNRGIHDNLMLPVPEPRRPYFGERALSPTLKEKWNDYYEDVLVLGYRSSSGPLRLQDSDEKALYYRAPYSSRPNVKPWLPSQPEYYEPSTDSIIISNNFENLTQYLQPDGSLDKSLAGDMTILRFGMRNNGAVTRPAPAPGLGFECDKFDTTAFNAHFDQYVGKLLKRCAPLAKNAGLTMLHMDSWEMGAQNWTDTFRSEFLKRRGYSLVPYLPTYLGYIVNSREKTERFLWDVRLTAQELVLENHVNHIKNLGERYGLGLSIEPYDMNPTSDLDMGDYADVPMCEFWSKGYGFNTTYSCFESSSIAHINGLPVVAAEAFTAGGDEAWKLYPGVLKNQGDWALCMGINKFVYHTFAHKPLGEQYRPGMCMGPYGVHWDRGQTWWPMVSAYHKYISRCSHLLRQGNTVADILYLTPEGAPNVFVPPQSALAGCDTLPDRKSYNFDTCSPLQLIAKAKVKNHRIVFPGGASYALLVLPNLQTMTPELLHKLERLVWDGAVIAGPPPLKSPSLVDYPQCDKNVHSLAEAMWGGFDLPDGLIERQYGKGKIISGSALNPMDASLFPAFEITATILEELAVTPDFESDGPIRYTHRQTSELDVYFVSNREDALVQTDCRFRSTKGSPELWDPLTGVTWSLTDYTINGEHTTIPLQFEPHSSYFIVFDQDKKTEKTSKDSNFKQFQNIAKITGPWQVEFDPKWGGPESIQFDELSDWSKHPNKGVKYYSGIAVYNKTFDLPNDLSIEDGLFLELGKVCNLAHVILNDQDLGIVWTHPWRVDISGAVKDKDNHLKIEIANLWPNRLIGDEFLPDDGIKDGQWPKWLLEGKPRTSGRYTFTTKRYYKKDSPLFESGLLGPVRLTKFN